MVFTIWLLWLLNANSKEHWDRDAIVDAVREGGQKEDRPRQGRSGRMDLSRCLGERRRHGSLSAGCLRPVRRRGRASNAAVGEMSRKFPTEIATNCDKVYDSTLGDRAAVEG